jgi:hypothetical protein
LRVHSARVFGVFVSNEFSQHSQRFDVQRRFKKKMRAQTIRNDQSFSTDMSCAQLIKGVRL